MRLSGDFGLSLLLELMKGSPVGNNEVWFNYIIAELGLNDVLRLHLDRLMIEASSSRLIK